MIWRFCGGWGQMGNQSPVNPLDQYATFVQIMGFSNWHKSFSRCSCRWLHLSMHRLKMLNGRQMESLNVGFDATLKKGITVTFDWFKNSAKDLLNASQRPLLGGILQQPFVNVGRWKQRLRGFDWEAWNIIPGLSYDANISFTHYKNKMIKKSKTIPNAAIYGSASRLTNVWRNTAGQPVSNFYGYQIDGFANTQLT